MALKTLILMRHAKSSWSHGEIDHERPLNGRGRRAAKAVGGVLRARKLTPDLIWSSDSLRTRETVAQLFADEDIETEFLSDLYHAAANKVLYVCQSRGEPDTDTLLLVGHNPGWEDLFYYFTGIARRYPTGGCAILTRTCTKTDWLDGQAWRLADFIKPKDLED